MATNPVIKLKRGVFANLTSYPLIDGQLFLGSSANSTLTPAYAKNDNRGYNVFAVDMEANGSVTRHYVDAYRAIYAGNAGSAVTAQTWTDEIPFSITDGTHTGTSVLINGGAQSYSLPLPATISAAIIGNVTGTADSAKAIVNAQGVAVDVGSSQKPVYFDDGVPVAVGNSLAVSITGNAATASALEATTSLYISDATSAHTGVATIFDGTNSSYTLKLPATLTVDILGNASTADALNTNAGSASRPVYFSGGVPTITNSTLDVSITGNAATATIADAFSTSAGADGTPVYLDGSGTPTAVSSLDAGLLTGTVPLSCIPQGAQERLYIANNLTAIQALTETQVQQGDVVKDAATNQMYYVTAPTVSGAIANTANTLGFVKFTAGSAASSAYADEAGSLSANPSIGISGGATGTATVFNGATGITIPVTALDLTYVNNGTLDVQYGGTGNASWTQYGIVYANTASSLSQLASGTSGQILKSNGPSSAPSWAAQSTIHAGTADALSTSITINGTSFDGSSSITTTQWGTSRNISIASSDGTGVGTAVAVNGSQAVTLLLPATIKASLTGKADTAGTADALAHQLHYTVTNVTGVNSYDNVTYGGSTNADTYFDLGPDDLFPTYKVTNYSTTANGGVWSTITIPTGMATGSYIVQVKVNGTTFTNEFFTGTMSYSSAAVGATESDSDEVFLHAAGSGLSGERIYMRTRRVASGSVVIEICASCNLTSSDVFNITFRRMI